MVLNFVVCSYLLDRIILGVDLLKIFGWYFIINECLVLDWLVFGVECELVIINFLIVGEVRCFCCVFVYWSVVSRGGLGGFLYGLE